MTDTPSLAERGHNLDLWPTENGPWFPYQTGGNQNYDNGIPWCSSADSHPERHGGYPHPDHPAAECRTRGGWFDSVREGLNGEELYLDVYAARSFEFGEPIGPGFEPTRIMFDVATGDNDDPGRRFSLTVGDALILARQLEHLSDVVHYYVADHVH